MHLVMSIFLLPTLYVWVSRDGNKLLLHRPFEPAEQTRRTLRKIVPVFDPCASNRLLVSMRTSSSRLNNCVDSFVQNQGDLCRS
jgi:hypothetical protein